MALHRFYLADSDDRNRLAEDGTVQPAHDCAPQYFDTADEAYHHPDADTLHVYSCPYTETLPGVGYGFATAEPTYDAVISPDIYYRVATEVHAIIKGA
jgi:hypothetical protein